MARATGWGSPTHASVSSGCMEMRQWRWSPSIPERWRRSPCHSRMRELRVLVVDDEPPSRRALLQLVAEHADLRPVGECRDGREALRALATVEPDLVLLDVQMPELDGFGVVREWGVERMPPVIFVTAYDEFALRAFSVHAIDYLLKPV